jgi:SAM-dependent methyltransferase
VQWEVCGGWMRSVSDAKARDPPLCAVIATSGLMLWRSVMVVTVLDRWAAAGLSVWPRGSQLRPAGCKRRHDTILAVEEYHRVVASLRQAYGVAAAAERDGREKTTFKLDERRRFLDLLRDRGATSLLEVGAGTGHDSLYFQRQGLRVLCTDLSPAMVELCRAKGLDARVADFLGLGVLPASFDAVYALNCLLHVPTSDLPRVLEAIGEVLVPGGLFYAGTWGGADEEGPMRDDQHRVPRFFAFRSDRLMGEILAERFHILSFTTFDADGNHFQSFMLEKPRAPLP